MPETEGCEIMFDFTLFAVPLSTAKPTLSRIDRQSGSLEKKGILSYIVGNTLELHKNC